MRRAGRPLASPLSIEKLTPKVLPVCFDEQSEHAKTDVIADNDLIDVRSFVRNRDAMTSLSANRTLLVLRRRFVVADRVFYRLEQMELGRSEVAYKSYTVTLSTHHCKE
jgi:hypothetical protein